MFYDDSGLHNQTATEMTIFDAPILSRAEGDLDNRLVFETYLVVPDSKQKKSAGFEPTEEVEAGYVRS